MSDIAAVVSNVSQWSIADRLTLVHAIWDTIPDDEELPQQELPPLSAEWLAEIERRSAAIDSGESKTIPWEQIRDRLQNRLKEIAK